MNNFKNLRDELTDDNFHTDAMIVECLESGRYDLIGELAKIAQQHEKQRYITKEMQDYRDNTIAKRLLEGN